MFRLIGGKRALGETSIYLAQKAPPEVDLSRPIHYRSWEKQAMPVEKPATDAKREMAHA
jgi:hypothetical protein